MAALGYSGVAIAPEKITVIISGQLVVDNGMEAKTFDENALHSRLKEREVTIGIRLGNGPGTFTAYTTDISPEYVRINSEYRT